MLERSKRDGLIARRPPFNDRCLQNEAALCPLSREEHETFPALTMKIIGTMFEDRARSMPSPTA